MPEPVTRTLHRLTSYTAERDWTDPCSDPRVVQGFTPMDPDRFPRPHKDYDLPRRPLAREWDAPDVPAFAALAGAGPAAVDDLDLTGLARFLFLCAGVTRTAERSGRTVLFRAAGSAGGRFPLEVYVAVPAGTTLPAGVHWYDPSEHALVEIGPPPAGGRAPTVVVTGIPWRTGWKYTERGFRHIYWDAGTMLSQLLAAADSAGVPAALHTRFPDSAVRGLVGADGLQEFPVAVVALGGGEPALEATGSAAVGRHDANGIEFPLVSSAQRAGDVDELGPELARGAAVVLSEEPAATLDDVVLRRGSTRRFDPAGSVPRTWLVDSMAMAMRGIDVPHRVVVNAVDGLQAGLYRWPDLSTPFRGGDLREELFSASLGQGLPADAAFVVIGAVDLNTVDDRGYREVQLRAGLVEGRLHLAAYALGVGASGMTFRDGDIPALLGEDLDGLLWTCVGVPQYRSRRGGRPGNAVRLDMRIQPRLEPE